MRLWERMKGQRGTAALLALLLVAVLACTALAESYPFAGTVNAATNMRRTPNSNQSNVIVKIPEGDAVTVLGASGNFYRIEYDGKTGYVFKKYVEKQRPSGIHRRSGEPSFQTLRRVLSARLQQRSAAGVWWASRFRQWKFQSRNCTCHL